ncbi:unnamed protein product [Staurois parvus]|uniref:Uncharacterized protein n=1 Tax=Staurois parvus TaxID=386267 RepID=A0ABN9B3H6_9NEOB|nr:unnamed protein product [Staurois parvus]
MPSLGCIAREVVCFCFFLGLYVFSRGPIGTVQTEVRGSAS